MAEVKIKIISYKSNGQKPGEDPPGLGPLSIDHWCNDGAEEPDWGDYND